MWLEKLRARVNPGGHSSGTRLTLTLRIGVPVIDCDLLGDGKGDWEPHWADAGVA